MNVRELHAALAREMESVGHNSENTVQIACTPPHTSIGGSHAIGIKSIHAGFDWDQGRTFIYPAETLYSNIGQMKDAAKAMEDIIGWIYSTEKGMCPKGSTLKMIKEVVARYQKKCEERRDKKKIVNKEDDY